MTEVALDRTDGQRITRGARLAQGLADGAGFDRVANGRTGTVGFEVVESGRIDPGLGIGALEQRRLCIGTGQGQAGFTTVGVHGAGSDHREDRVAVGHGLIVILEQEQTTALGARVTVTVLIEGLATPGTRQHRGLGENHEAERVHVQADAASHRLIDIAADDRLAGLVKGHQRRRARGVDRHARATQVVEERQAVGGNAHGVASGRGGIDRRQVFHQAIGLLDTGDPQVHTAIAAAQARGLDARVLEGFPAHFQEEALLRVHHRRFPWRDVEEARIEGTDVAQATGGKGITGGRVGFIRVQEFGVIPARGVDLGHQVPPCHQVLPEIAGRGTGETKRTTNNCYLSRLCQNPFL
ncbi:hypothetical protein D3C84_214610 [compost metagenome]